MLGSATGVKVVKSETDHEQNEWCPRKHLAVGSTTVDACDVSGMVAVVLASVVAFLTAFEDLAHCAFCHRRMKTALNRFVQMH